MAKLNKLSRMLKVKLRKTNLLVHLDCYRIPVTEWAQVTTSTMKVPVTRMKIALRLVSSDS
jgi:hypothetical protein